jgi:hypothetical protein
MREYWCSFYRLLAQQFFYRIMEGYKRARDAGSARAAVCLDDIAIDLDGTLPKLCQIHYGPEGPSYQALDFHRASRLLAPGSFTLHPLIR